MRIQDLLEFKTLSSEELTKLGQMYANGDTLDTLSAEFNITHRKQVVRFLKRLPNWLEIQQQHQQHIQAQNDARVKRNQDIAKEYAAGTKLLVIGKLFGLETGTINQILKSLDNYAELTKMHLANKDKKSLGRPRKIIGSEEPINGRLFDKAFPAPLDHAAKAISPK